MPINHYTEVTEETWGSRVGKSIKSVGAGALMFLVAFPLLFWNEHRAVQTAKSIDETQKVTVESPSDKANPANDGKCIYTTGVAKTVEPLGDIQFDLSLTALRFQRSVEMYQWVEKKTEKKHKEGTKEVTETTYDYVKEWKDKVVDSGSFKIKRGHDNPESLAFQPILQNAKDATVGVFALPVSLIQQITSFEPLPEAEGPKPAHLKEMDITLSEGAYYTGNPSDPFVGMCRMKFSIVRPTELSIIAMQRPVKGAGAGGDGGEGEPATEMKGDAAPEGTAKAGAAASSDAEKPASPDGAAEKPAASGDSTEAPAPAKTPEAAAAVAPAADEAPAPIPEGAQAIFAPYQTQAGDKIWAVEVGHKTSAEMFEIMRTNNLILTWALRVFGFLLMAAGLRMIFAPLAVLVDVVPFVGTVVGAGLTFFCVSIAAGLSVLTVGTAWLFYRPLIGAPMLVAAVALIVLVFLKGKKKRASVAPATDDAEQLEDDTAIVAAPAPKEALGKKAARPLVTPKNGNGAISSLKDRRPPLKKPIARTMPMKAAAKPEPALEPEPEAMIEEEPAMPKDGVVLDSAEALIESEDALVADEKPAAPKPPPLAPKPPPIASKPLPPSKPAVIAVKPPPVTASEETVLESEDLELEGDVLGDEEPIATRAVPAAAMAEREKALEAEHAALAEERASIEKKIAEAVASQVAEAKASLEKDRTDVEAKASKVGRAYAELEALVEKKALEVIASEREAIARERASLAADRADFEGAVGRRAASDVADLRREVAAERDEIAMTRAGLSGEREETQRQRTTLHEEQRAYAARLASAIDAALAPARADLDLERKMLREGQEDLRKDREALAADRKGLELDRAALADQVSRSVKAATAATEAERARLEKLGAAVEARIAADVTSRLDQALSTERCSIAEERGRLRDTAAALSAREGAVKAEAVKVKEVKEKLRAQIAKLEHERAEVKQDRAKLEQDRADHEEEIAIAAAPEPVKSRPPRPAPRFRR